MLLLLVVAIRYVPGAGEVYALYLYPTISLVLSWLSSFIPYSLEELIVVAATLIIVLYPVVALKKKRRLLIVLKNEVVMICWIFVWFYLGWGCNYYRNDLLTRMMIQPASFEKAEFKTFLNEYTEKLNSSYVRVDSVDKERTLQEVKSIYNTLPDGYGLTKPKSFQCPKRLLFNGLYNGVGVLGYMGPFMAESQLNLDLLPSEYAFTLAHETAHLLGVSSEAEANFWAFNVCSSSDIPDVRCSGYLGLLPYVWQNAQGLLTEKEMEEWRESIDKDIIAEIQSQGEYWQAKRSPIIKEIQTRLYDWFLKGNNIQSGMANYSEVIGLIMATAHQRLK
ncbi:MAG: DUF3810 domain-containing protein [Bacteroidaceae bacterium]|nr:DUF3810 domain-containing protein [Bacteroidaceae bacterium]